MSQKSKLKKMRFLEIKTTKRIEKSLKLSLKFSLFFFIFSFFYTPPIPQEKDFLPELQNEPNQTFTKKKRFMFMHKDKYEIWVKPTFDYELWGTVVSQPSMMSILDKDNVGNEIRIKDFCVIWGDNLKNDIGKNMEYRSENYTCFYRTKIEEYWDKFNPHQLSNNHLITDNKALARKIKKIEIGDQIYLKGSLVEYGFPPDQMIRASSTTRTDRGNGACETIFVEDLKILKKSTPVISMLLKINKFYFPLLLIFYVIWLFKYRDWTKKKKRRYRDIFNPGKFKEE